MSFTSLSFFLFFIIVFFLYWFAFNRSKSVKTQNIFLVLCSYIFYGFSDWRFLILLLFSTLLGYVIGLQISGSTDKIRKRWMMTGVGVNLVFLGFFKYFNFFTGSFNELFQLLKLSDVQFSILDILLPVGISFYTFRGLAYMFDVYNRKIAAQSSWINYSLFIGFFPLLLVGPIERAASLMPQVERKRELKYLQATDGLRQILWGLFKVIVVANSCGVVVNPIFANYETASGSALALAAVLFSVQIYGDFSGYTDIALGVARLLGFELSQNFNFPYFSKNIADFWRRWHITLSSWFRDYLYIPLGGSRNGLFKTVRNVIIVFLISGLWHGASWTFVMWGGLHALCLSVYVIIKTFNKTKKSSAERDRLTLIHILGMIATFLFCSFARIFYRSGSVADAISFTKRIFTAPFLEGQNPMSGLLILVVIFFFVIEWLGKEGKYGLQRIGARWKYPYRWAFYYLLIVSIGYFWDGGVQQFIYFQF